MISLTVEVQVVVRDCIYIGGLVEDYCDRASGDFTSGSACFCTRDQCNSSVTILPSPLLALCIVVLSFIIV